MFLPLHLNRMHPAMLDPSWYHRPLDFEDIIAGTSLFLLGAVSITISILVSSVMWKQDKMIVGYRFLCSASISDIMLLFNYGIWPGLTILLKSEIISPSMRHWIQLYLDWAWFSMVWHFSLVGWSRWSAIRRPLSFRNQKRRRSYALCLCCYIIALIQVLSTHFQPWYVTFYYEPSSYGMLAENFALYMSGGQSAMFLAFHVAAIVPPIIFYTWAVLHLIYRKKTTIITSHTSSNLNNIEKRLMLPCIINLIVFVIGQLVITYGTGEGKWAGWTVMFLFCCNSAVNPILLIICSRSIRVQLLTTLGIRQRSCEKLPGETVLYQNNNALEIVAEVKEVFVTETVLQPLDSDEGSTESVVYV